MTDTLLERIGTYRTAGKPGAARLTLPKEINGLQAHTILLHNVEPAAAFSLTVHELAVRHTVRHAKAKMGGHV